MTEQNLNILLAEGKFGQLEDILPAIFLQDSVGDWATVVRTTIVEYNTKFNAVVFGSQAKVNLDLNDFMCLGPPGLGLLSYSSSYPYVPFSYTFLQIVAEYYEVALSGNSTRELSAMANASCIAAAIEMMAYSDCEDADSKALLAKLICEDGYDTRLWQSQDLDPHQYLLNSKHPDSYKPARQSLTLGYCSPPDDDPGAACLCSSNAAATSHNCVSDSSRAGRRSFAVWRSKSVSFGSAPALKRS